MPKLLVTGAGGRLGRLLRAAHARDGSGAQILFQSRGDTADIRWSPGDDLGALPCCDAVLALWGRTGGSAQELSDNSRLAQISLDVARATGAGMVFHVSSAAVYGPGAGLDEAAPTRPGNDYGRAKLVMEQRIASFPPNGMTHCILRLANVVGADSLAPALQGPGPARLDRFADGRGPVRSYIAASDLLDVVTALACKPAAALPPVLNVAAPRPVAMQDLLQAAGKAITWQRAPSKAVQDVTLDAGALSRLLPATRCRNEAGALIADWRELETRA